MRRIGRNRYLALKIAVFDWIMRRTPGLRGFLREHERLIASLAEAEEELRELRSERDALLRGMSLLLDERVSRDPR